MSDEAGLPVVKVRPGVNITHAGVVKVTLRAWARLRVWGARIWKIAGRDVKVVPASVCQ